MFARVLRSNNKAASALLAAPRSQQVRRLNLHEYQSLDIMKTFGVATPQGIPATTPAEAEAAFNKIKAGRCTCPCYRILAYACLLVCRHCTYERDSRTLLDVVSYQRASTS